MTPALSREERDAIRARAEAADPAPWEYALDTEEIVSPDGGIAEMTWPGRNRTNAEFIAHARTDVPALLDALDAAEEENERLRGLLGLVPSPFVDKPATFEEALHKIAGLRGALATALTERDAARADLAALREAVEAIAHDWETYSRHAAASMKRAGKSAGIVAAAHADRLRAALAVDGAGDERRHG